MSRLRESGSVDFGIDPRNPGLRAQRLKEDALRILASRRFQVRLLQADASALLSQFPTLIEALRSVGLRQRRSREQSATHTVVRPATDASEMPRIAPQPRADQVLISTVLPASVSTSVGDPGATLNEAPDMEHPVTTQNPSLGRDYINGSEAATVEHANAHLLPPVTSSSWLLSDRALSQPAAPPRITRPSPAAGRYEALSAPEKRVRSVGPAAVAIGGVLLAAIGVVAWTYFAR
jgi:hypothetical protein